MPEPPLPKETGQSYLFKIRDCEKGESQGWQKLHLGKKEKRQSESMKVERLGSTSNQDGFQKKEWEAKLRILSRERKM